MKTSIKYLAILTIAFGALFTNACKKSFYTNANKNPNAPATVTPASLLPTTEAALAYTQGGDMSRFSSLLMQQSFGNGNQSQAYYQYILNAQDFDNLWPDLYTSTMENNYTLMKLADGKGYNVYSGISRILMAYTLQITVDYWGKVPYSQALMGAANTQPAYDNDKALYDTILATVDAGIARLNNSNTGVLVPGADDLVYGGDATKWIKFGHAIKSRVYLHQSKNNAAMANNALTEINASFASNADNAQLVFGTAQTNAAPWNQFMNNRNGDITFANSTIAGQLLALHDPRYPIFIDSTGGSSSADLANYYGSTNSPVEFITYDEMMFAKAEATITAGGTPLSAQPFYVAGITANMTKLGVSGTDMTTYLAANGTLPATSATAIAQIASQEYIALFLNPETWTLWRRTASPALTSKGGTNGIPRRLLYPQSELSYNAANTPAATLYTPKIFWDN